MKIFGNSSGVRMCGGFLLLVITAYRVSAQTVVEDKGSAFKIPAPEWCMTYLSGGIMAVEALPEYRGRLCVIGDASGVNMVTNVMLANISAGEQIGMRLASYVGDGDESLQQYVSRLSKELTVSQSVRWENDREPVISYGGFQLEADWWQRVRRSDPDRKGSYVDEYRVYILYTIPKAEFDTMQKKMRAE
jgi:hypothetical protein